MSKEKMKTCTIFRSLSFFLLVRWSLCIALSTRTLNFSAKQSARQFYPEVVSNSVPKYLMTAGPSLLIHFSVLLFHLHWCLGSFLALQCCDGCFVLGVCAEWVAHVMYISLVFAF